MEKKLVKENKCDHRGTSEQTNKQQTGKIEQLGQWMLEDRDKQSPLLVRGTSFNYLLIIYFEI